MCRIEMLSESACDHDPLNLADTHPGIAAECFDRGCKSSFCHLKGPDILTCKIDTWQKLDFFGQIARFLEKILVQRARDP